jgi:hypothetical protein
VVGLFSLVSPIVDFHQIARAKVSIAHYSLEYLAKPQGEDIVGIRG